VQNAGEQRACAGVCMRSAASLLLLLLPPLLQLLLVGRVQ
jgi:hypothetical protein